MSKQYKERLSGLVDDELNGSADRFLLSRLSHDLELRQSWRRYHLYGELLRSGRRALDVQLSSGVAAAIAEDPAPTARLRMPRWLKPAAGVAVAATVAVAAFTGLYVQPGSDTPIQVPTTAGNFDSTPGLPQQASVASVTGDPWTNPRLQSYVLRHNEATMRRGQGLVPYIYMVSAPESAENQDASDETAPTTD